MGQTEEELPLRSVVFNRIVVRTSGTGFKVNQARELADEVLGIIEEATDPSERTPDPAQASPKGSLELEKILDQIKAGGEDWLYVQENYDSIIAQITALHDAEQKQAEIQGRIYAFSQVLHYHDIPEEVKVQIRARVKAHRGGKLRAEQRQRWQERRDGV